MISIPVFEVEQPVGSFFIGVMKASSLLSICKFDYRRMQYQNGYIDFLGIQRELNLKRIDDLKKYVGTVDACFPTSIVISIDEKCASVQETEIVGAKIMKIFAHEDAIQPELSIPLAQVASIIDGQHRLRGLEEAGMEDFELTVSIFIGADDATEAMVFSIVNLAQTKVNKSLVYDLFALANSRSPEKTCHEIVVALDQMEESPFQNKIKRLGVATEGRFGETLSQATIVKGILPYITSDPVEDRDRGKRFGFWDPVLAKDVQKRIFAKFFRDEQDVKILDNLLNYFRAVKERWPVAWDRGGTGNILIRTNGFNGLIRFLRPAYLYHTSEPRVVSQREYEEIFARVDLADEDFNPQRFLPGSSGSTAIYNELVRRSGIGTAVKLP